MRYIDGIAINTALEKVSRVYLLGHLESPQEELPHFDDGEFEIGISYYKEYTAPHPHVHSDNQEYNYIVSGRGKILLMDTEEEFELGPDSLFVIDPNMPHCIKWQPNSRILFIKNPGGNDKKEIDINDKIANWMDSWNNKY